MRDGRVTIDLEVPRQQLERWCWAAIACGIGKYYEKGSWTQAQIASKVLGIDCERFEQDETIKQEADTVTRLDKALKVAGCYSHWSPGKPQFDRVKFEINQGRPLAARIEWFTGSAHYAVIHGYDESSASVLVADPMHGSSEHPLEHFPARYLLGGAWTETFWTRHSKSTIPAEVTNNQG